MSGRKKGAAAAFWGRHIGILRSSGLTHKEYCHRYKLNIHTLRSWTMALGRGKDAVKPKTVERKHQKQAFIPVKMLSADFQVGCRLMIETHQGHRLMIRHGGSLAEVAELILALEGRSSC